MKLRHLSVPRTRRVLGRVRAVGADITSKLVRHTARHHAALFEALGRLMVARTAGPEAVGSTAPGAQRSCVCACPRVAPYALCTAAWSSRAPEQKGVMCAHCVHLQFNACSPWPWQF